MAGLSRLRDPDVRLLRQSAQLLHRPARSSVSRVVRHLIGAPAQDLRAAGLAVRARSQGVTAEAVQRARVGERTVVWTWAMRGTLHLIAAEDHPWLVPLAAESSLAGAHRRVREEGLTGDQPELAVRTIERMLGRDGPATRSEIGDRLERARIPARGQGLIHVIRLAALKGLVCHGPDRNGEPAFVLVRDWLSPGESVDRERAVTELATRYVKAYGPATPEDFGMWSGLSAADARRGWRSIAHRLIEVATPAGPMWTVGRPDPHPQTGVVRLIPGFDPYLLGWRRRDLSVPRGHERQVFPGGGMLRSTVLVDGRASGTWSSRRTRDGVTVTVRPFGRLAPAVRRSLTDEAADLGRYLRVPIDLTLG